MRVPLPAAMITMFRAMRCFQRPKPRLSGRGCWRSLLLGGCSAVRIGYNQAPTLAWWWLDGYWISMPSRRRKVKDALNQWFAWHRTTQLPDYADLLAAAQAAGAAAGHAAAGVPLGRRPARAAGGGLRAGRAVAAELLPTLTPEQLAHLERRYRKSNRDFEDDFLQQDADERLKAAVKRTVDRAEMLYGRLDERQRQLIAAGVAASPFDPAAWFAERQAVQSRDAADAGPADAGGPARADRESNLAGLQALAARVQRAPPGPTAATSSG